MVKVFHPPYSTDLNQKYIFFKNFQPLLIFRIHRFHIEIGISVLFSMQYNIGSKVQHNSYPTQVTCQPLKSFICDPCAIIDHLFSLLVSNSMDLSERLFIKI